MKSTFKEHNITIVDLTEGVFVRTIIAKENHAALRSGFAGYPPNPRWSINKYHAWKTGSQWRQDLSQGKMVIRREDSLLVSLAELESEADQSEPQLSPSRASFFPRWLFPLPSLTNSI
jgi:hypothetical protein